MIRRRWGSERVGAGISEEGGRVVAGMQERRRSSQEQRGTVAVAVAVAVVGGQKLEQRRRGRTKRRRKAKRRGEREREREREKRGGRKRVGGVEGGGGSDIRTGGGSNPVVNKGCLCGY